MRRFGFQSWDDGTRLYRARAEARPSCPILSFAWNHVGALVWCGGAGANQPDPTHRTTLSFACTSASQPTALLRSPSLALPPPRPHPPSPPAPVLVLVLFLLYYSASSYHCRCWCYYCRCRCRYSFATLGLPPTATHRRPSLPPTAAPRPPASVLWPPKPPPPPALMCPSHLCCGDAHVRIRTHVPARMPHPHRCRCRPYFSPRSPT